LQEVLQRFHAKTLESRKNDFNVEQAEIYKQEEEEFQQRSQKFFQALSSYEDAPFTLQRLCELILTPEKTYSNTRKYLSALEKMVNITSTIQTLTPQEIQTINTTGVITSSSSSVPNFSENIALFQQSQLLSPSSDGPSFSNSSNGGGGESMNIDAHTSSTTAPMDLQ